MVVINSLTFAHSYFAIYGILDYTFFLYIFPIHFRNTLLCEVRTTVLRNKWRYSIVVIVGITIPLWYNNVLENVLHTVLQQCIGAINRHSGISMYWSYF